MGSVIIMENRKFIFPSFLGGFLGILFGGWVYVFEGTMSPLITLLFCVFGFFIGTLFTKTVRVKAKKIIQDLSDNLFVRMVFGFCSMLILFTNTRDFFKKVFGSIKNFFVKVWKFICKLRNIKIRKLQIRKLQIRFEPFFSSEKKKNVFIRIFVRTFVAIISGAIFLTIGYFLTTFLWGFDLIEGKDWINFSKAVSTSSESGGKVFLWILFAMFYIVVPVSALSWMFNEETKREKYFAVKLCGKNPWSYVWKNFQKIFLMYFKFFYVIFVLAIIFGILSSSITFIGALSIIFIFLLPYSLLRGYLIIANKRSTVFSLVVCMVITIISFYIYRDSFFNPFLHVICAFGTGVFVVSVNALLLGPGEALLKKMYAFEKRSKERYTFVDGWGESIICYSGILWIFIWKVYKKLPEPLRKI